METKYICTECGKAFDEPKIVSEGRGEYWGTPCYEDVAVCPYCGMDAFEEASQCDCCEEWYLAEEWHDGYCPKCYNRIMGKYRFNPTEIFKVVEREEEKEAIRINSFLAYAFRESEIEEILYKELSRQDKFAKENPSFSIDCKDYIDNDLAMFEVEEGGEEE